MTTAWAASTPGRKKPWAFFQGGYVAALAWALCSWLYLWTANWDPAVYARYDAVEHHYEYLVDGFLAGHAHLSIDPPKELLALPDPYDAKQNKPYRLGDSSLFRGKYYLYFGPTPVLVLMVPWKLLTGCHLPQRIALGLWASLGLGALAMLLTGIRRHHFPQTPRWLLFFAVVLAGHICWLPVVLRRPAFWELAIVAAAASFWWALFFLWKFHLHHGKALWGVAGGAALALTLGARPNYLFTTGFVALLFAFGGGYRFAIGPILRRVLPVIVPLALGGVALLAYNYARFGKISEFGAHYMLWGSNWDRTMLFSWDNFAFNASLYLISIPTFGPYFPFVHSAWIGPLPAGYYEVENMQGIVLALPASVVGLATLAGLRRRALPPAFRATAIAAVGGGFFSMAVLFLLPGACNRYTLELMAGWTLVTALGFFLVFSPDFARPGRSLARLAALSAGVFSIAYTWLASFEYRDLTVQTHPEFYRAVATFFNYPSWWYARNNGTAFGPVECDVQLSEQPTTGTFVLLAAGRRDRLNKLILERHGAGKIRLRLIANYTIIAETPILSYDRPTLRVICAAPWLYPPTEHPYWLNLPDSAERNVRQTLHAIGVEGTWTRVQSSYTFDATSLEPFVHMAPVDASTEGAWITRWERLKLADPAEPLATPVTPTPADVSGPPKS